MTAAKSQVQAKKKYHHGDLRGQLLEAVRGLLEARGPDGFSIAEACRLAGVSTAAPYKHFRDRHEILRGVVLLGMTRLRDAMRAAADAHPPGTTERVAALGQAYVDFAREEPGVFRAIFGVTEGHEEDAELRALGDETFGVVAGVVADHLGAAPDAPEVAARAYALWCFVHGHSFLALDHKLASGVHVPEADLLRLVGAAMLGR